MDSLTHLVLGHAMGAFTGGATPSVQAGAYWGALVGNSLPDIDVPVGYLLRRGWAFHRKFTHTIPGVVVLSLGATLVITLAIPGSNPWLTLAWTLAGCVIHVFLDCLNLFGTRPFWPFANQVLGTGTLFIMDPVILATLGLGGLAQLAGVMGLDVLRALYVSMVLYLAIRCFIQVHLRRSILMRSAVVRGNVVAWLAGWRYFRETETHMEYGIIRTGTGTTQIASFEKATGPVVEATHDLPQVQEFLRRARYPFAQVSAVGQGHRVLWQDLYMKLRDRQHGVEVLLDEHLHICE